MNVALAALFAASYATIAILHPSQRAPVWFAASYGVGMLTPIAQLGLASGAWTEFFGALVFFSFAFAWTIMVPGLAVFYRQPIPWRLTAALVAVTLIVAAMLVQLDRNSFAYKLAYQMPFMLGAFACAYAVLRGSARCTTDLVLAALFGLTALHFPIKAVVAAYLGTGESPVLYATTAYAMISQVSGGVLLVATGLALLINAVLAVVRETQAEAETDSLSGVLNRRGFEARAASLFSSPGVSPAALLLLDIDHFKRINDTQGHAVGDRTIRWLAGAVTRVSPKLAIVGRIGGEEFGVLFPGSTRETARLQAEAIREAAQSHGESDIPALTVSIGITDIRGGDLLHMALERADAALYDAKHSGRNRVCLAPVAEPSADNVVAFRRGIDA